MGRRSALKAAQAVYVYNSGPWGGAQAVLKPAQVLKAEAAQIRAAGLSVLAHLIDLQSRGLVREAGDAWSLAA